MSIPELKWDNCERVSRLCRNIGDKLIVWSNETQDGEIANSEGNTSEPDRAFMQILQDRSLLHDKLFLRSDDKQAQAVSAFLLQYAEEFVIVLSLDTSRDLCEIHVANANMRLKGIRTIGGVEYHQLRLSKCDQHEYLLHPESAVVEKWQAALRKVCLQTRFSESYTELAMIGRGNFAQVYSIQRKSDLKLFATKRFDKKLILKDSFEKVRFAYYIEMYSLRNQDDASYLPQLDT